MSSVHSDVKVGWRREIQRFSNGRINTNQEGKPKRERERKRKQLLLELIGNQQPMGTVTRRGVKAETAQTARTTETRGRGGGRGGEGGGEARGLPQARHSGCRFRLHSAPC